MHLRKHVCLPTQVFSSAAQLLRSVFSSLGLQRALQQANPLAQVELVDDASSGEEDAVADTATALAPQQKNALRSGSSDALTGASNSNGRSEDTFLAGGAQENRGALAEEAVSASCCSTGGEEGHSRAEGKAAVPAPQEPQVAAEQAHAQMLTLYHQRKAQGGKLSREGSLTWNTMFAYCCVLGTLAFFFHVR